MNTILRKIKFRFAPIKVPIIDWLPEYNKAIFISDLGAGLTVFFLIVPQSMAYALVSGLPTVYGLYSSTIPLFVYALLGTSRQISMGPMAITSLLLGVVCQKSGYEDGTDGYIKVAMNMSMLVGLILFLVGVCKLGTLINLLSNSVLTGFISGSAVVIVVNQIKYLLGFHAPRFPYLHQTIYYLCSHLHESNGTACALGFITLFALMAARELKKRIKVCPPGWSKTAHIIVIQLCNFSNFLALVIGMAIAKGIYDQGGSVPIVGNIPSGMMTPSFEIAPVVSLLSMLPDAVALSFVSFAGNWAISVKYAWDNHYEVDATQELIAEGLTNILGVVFHSFVVSGGLGRSAVNADSGAKTQIASCITAFCVLICLLFFTSLLYYIPMASLGAVLQVAVFPLFNYQEMLHSYRVDRRDCFVMVLTCLSTMFIGVAEGLYIGIATSTLMVVWTTAFPIIAHLGRLDAGKARSNTISTLFSFKQGEPSGGSAAVATSQNSVLEPNMVQEEVTWGPGEHHYYRNVERYPEAVQIPGFAIVRMDASLYYANSAYFKETIIAASKGEYHSNKDVPIKKVIIDASAWVSMDLAAVKTLFELQKELATAKPPVVLAIAAAKAVIRDQLKKAKFVSVLGRENLNMSIDDAILTPTSLERSAVNRDIHNEVVEGSAAFLENGEGGRVSDCDMEMVGVGLSGRSGRGTTASVAAVNDSLMSGVDDSEYNGGAIERRAKSVSTSKKITTLLTSALRSSSGMGGGVSVNEYIQVDDEGTPLSPSSSNGSVSSGGGGVNNNDTVRGAVVCNPMYSV